MGRVEFVEPGRVGLGVEHGRNELAAAPGHGHRLLPVPADPAYGVGYGPGVALGEEQAGLAVAHDLGYAADVGGSHGHGVGEGFHDDVGDAVAVAVAVDHARHHQHVVALHVFGDAVVGHEAGQVHGVLEPEALDLVQDAALPDAVADQRQAYGEALPAQAGDGGEQEGKALGAAESPHGKHPAGGLAGAGAGGCGFQGEAVVDQPDLALGSLGGMAFQPGHVRLVVGAHEARIPDLFRQKPVLGIDVAGTPGKGEGDAGHPRGHPGCRGRPVGPGGVEEGDASLPGAVGYPEAGKEGPGVLAKGLEAAQAPEEHLARQAPDEAGRFADVGKECGEERPRGLGAKAHDASLIAAHLPRLACGLVGVEAEDVDGHATLLQSAHLAEDEGLRGERKPQEDVGAGAREGGGAGRGLRRRGVGHGGGYPAGCSPR